MYNLHDCNEYEQIMKALKKKVYILNNNRSNKIFVISFIT